MVKVESKQEVVQIKKINVTFKAVDAFKKICPYRNR